MAMSLTEFLETYKPAFKVIPVDFRPDRNMGNLAYHFMFRLGYQGREYIGFFSQGSKANVERVRGYNQYGEFGWVDKQLPPSITSVLECLQIDCQTGENTYQEFASEYGYKADSSEEYECWEACRKTRDGMIDLFGRGPFSDFMEISFE